jgi:DNA (cytosine-5)-methyltransferase 1
MLRAIREIQPRWVVGENVLGLVNWSGGLVFHEVQADLEAAGYEVFPYVLPAVSVNAPHRRDRVWFVAHAINGGHCTGRGTVEEKNGVQGIGGEAMGARKSDRTGISRDAADTNGVGHKGWATKSNSDEERQICQSEQNNGDGVWQSDDGCRNGVGDVADTSNKRLQGCKVNGSVGGIGEIGNKQFTGCVPSNWQNFPTQSPICSGDDELSRQLDGITFPKWRNESIKAYGNAVVPALVYQIFKTIEQYETLTLLH